MKCARTCFMLYLVIHLSSQLLAQQGQWTLWASGLANGVYPRMAVAPDHSIYYTLLGAGVQLGRIYQANTQEATGDFHSLPVIPRPATIQNNIVAVGYNQDS